MGIVERLLDRPAQYGPSSLEVRAADIITRIKGYVAHSDECAINGWLPRGDEPCPPCTCGLSALIKEIDNGDR